MQLRKDAVTAGPDELGELNSLLWEQSPRVNGGPPAPGLPRRGTLISVTPRAKGSRRPLSRRRAEYALGHNCAAVYLNH